MTRNGIEAGTATTAGRGPQDESPVGEADAPELLRRISTLTAEAEEWKRIAGDFAGAAERCAEPPHYIVQPFLGLFKKYGAQLTLTKGSSILTQREPHD